MPTAADHLAAFVSGLAGPDAARLGRALAGEAPLRFRGRVLLERAAHLARESDLSLHEIAADCGFARYDVFTRAFRREFGVLPSAWRAEPTSYVVDAPGDVHFHPPAHLRLPARQRSDGGDLVVEMAEHHVRLVAELLDRSGPVADTDLDRRARWPDEDADTLRGALSRLVDEIAACAEVLGGGARVDAEPDVAGKHSVAALRRRLDLAGSAFVEAVAVTAGAGRLDEVVVAAFAPGARMLSHGAAVAQVLTSAHDRVLAVACLRACGIDDPLLADRRPPLRA
ncbi:helix-turn-helix domain-containing protein [Nocardioides sp. SYSU D00065]|uniref:helix-turn-helix domain-containing protein n=1 Tax=Nocardioides sp. SYSU D00065 TaxID=2817378 RepID=UPI001B31F6A0|nr:helix-turn-helix domain-containing protein [Nocardioides sp. SYSU D00065]